MATPPHEDGGTPTSEQKVGGLSRLSIGAKCTPDNFCYFVVIIARRIRQKARIRSHPRDRVGLNGVFVFAALLQRPARILVNQPEAVPVKSFYSRAQTGLTPRRPSRATSRHASPSRTHTRTPQFLTQHPFVLASPAYRYHLIAHDVPPFHSRRSIMRQPPASEPRSCGHSCWAIPTCLCVSARILLRLRVSARSELSPSLDLSCATTEVLELGKNEAV